MGLGKHKAAAFAAVVIAITVVILGASMNGAEKSRLVAAENGDEAHTSIEREADASVATTSTTATTVLSPTTTASAHTPTTRPVRPGVSTTTPATAIASAPQRLAYASWNGSKYELRVRTFPESGYDKLIDRNVSFYPSWSPDGTTLAFGTGTHIALFNVDTHHRVDLATTGERDDWPSWSPDGGRIAYVCDFGLCVMNRDGSSRHRLADMGAANWFPQWSPDGGRIAFTAQTSARRYSLFVINADGSGKTEIVRDEYGVDHPLWSPDGRWIVFDTQTPYDETDPGEEFRAIRPDGSGLKTLVRGTISDVFNWSFDSSRVVFSGLSTKGLHFVNVDTGVMEAVQTEGYSHNPTFSRDGRYVVYKGTCAGDNQALCALDTTTRAVTMVSPDTAGGRPMFAPR
ncbi:MAG: hypothetical protein Q8K63_07795 [Acidimicrobiales bacterium]|nr:hypothetical protein [Acidimicrobiales bacterium]